MTFEQCIKINHYLALFRLKYAIYFVPKNKISVVQFDNTKQFDLNVNLGNIRFFYDKRDFTGKR